MSNYSNRFITFTLVLTASALNCSMVFGADNSSVLPGALKSCVSCHAGAAAAGGLRFDLGTQGLIDGGFVLPGNAVGSKIFQAIQNRVMPPAPMPKLSVDQIGGIKGWIDSLSVREQKITNLNPSEVTKAMISGYREGSIRSDDLVIVLSGSLLKSSEVGSIPLFRTALTKAINSASRAPHIVTPRVLTGFPNVLLFSTTQLRWDNIALLSKFARQSRHSSDLVQGIRRDLVARADLAGTKETMASRVFDAATTLWAVTEPDIYLQLLYPTYYERAPNLEEFLESVVGPLKANLEYPVWLSGFLKSNVAINQRTVYRIESASGYVWGSGDFEFSRTDRDLRSSLYHLPDGGEFVVRLPNGLQLYLVANQNGRLLVDAPKSIVKDPRRSDETIRSPTSCFACHGNTGIISRAASDAISWSDQEDHRSEINR